jgi:transposase
MNQSIASQCTSSRRPLSELSTNARAVIISKIEQGVSQRKLAAEFQVSKSCIFNTFQRWKTYNQVESRTRSGRPSIIDDRTKRKIVRTAKSDPKSPYKEFLNNIHHSASKRTITRVLKEEGISKKRAKVRPALKESHALQRLKFAREYASFEWETTPVIFSDECSLERGTGKNNAWVFRTPDQKWDKEMVDPRSRQRTNFSQMIWACFWLDEEGVPQKSDIIFMNRGEGIRGGCNSQSYQDTLEQGLLQHYRPGMRFQQDNAPIHKSLSTREWLESHGIWTIDWPPFSPDLNPIEHLWYALKRKVYELRPDLEHMGRSEAEIEVFFNVIQEAWAALPNELLHRLIISMGDRLREVERSNGWYTKY